MLPPTSVKTEGGVGNGMISENMRWEALSRKRKWEVEVGNGSRKLKGKVELESGRGK
jgi:hypothetical protein